MVERWRWEDLSPGEREEYRERGVVVNLGHDAGPETVKRFLRDEFVPEQPDVWAILLGASFIALGLAFGLRAVDQSVSAAVAAALSMAMAILSVVAHRLE